MRNSSGRDANRGGSRNVPIRNVNEDAQRPQKKKERPQKRSWQDYAVNLPFYAGISEVTVHPRQSREAIFGQNARKSRESWREMLRKQHFCASRSALLFATRRGVNSNDCWEETAGERTEVSARKK